MLEVVEVNSSQEIVYNIFDMIEKYHRDMIPYFNYTVFEIYELVRKLPYKLEDGEFQLLSRPKKVISGECPFVACANKSLVLGSYFKLKNIPFCLTIVGYSEDSGYSHIFPEIKVGQKLLPIDATLTRYRLSIGPEQYNYLERVVPPWCKKDLSLERLEDG